MRMPKFNHVRSGSLKEAAALIAQSGGRTTVYAGGTELFPRMKYGLAGWQELVSTNGISVKPPEVNGEGELILDALTTLNQLATSSLVRDHSPALVEAAKAVASNQIRNTATLGGNLCQETRCLYFNQSHAFQFVEPCYKRGGNLCYLAAKGKKCWAVFMSDLATSLMALGARVELISDQAERLIPLDDLYSGNSQKPLALKPGEILGRVIIPAWPRGTGTVFTKFSIRGGVEFGGFNLAVKLTLAPDLKTCLGVSLVCGCISGGPLRIQGLSEMVKEKAPASDLFAEAAQHASGLLRPFPHHGYSAAYLKEVLKQEIERSLALAAEKAAENAGR